MKRIYFLAILSALLIYSCENKSGKTTGDAESQETSNSEDTVYYFQEDLKSQKAFDSVFNELRDPSVPRSLGTRISLSLSDVDAEHGNYVSWRDKIKYPRSRRAGNKRIVTSVSYSFGIDQVKKLIDDIENSDKAGEITGLRVQLYEKPTSDNNLNLIDAFIVAVNEEGDPIPQAIVSKEDANGNLVLNASNPCPDVCGPQ